MQLTVLISVHLRFGKCVQATMRYRISRSKQRLINQAFSQHIWISVTGIANVIHNSIQHLEI